MKESLTDRQRTALQLSWRIGSVTRHRYELGPGMPCVTLEDRITFTPRQLLDFVAQLDAAGR